MVIFLSGDVYLTSMPGVFSVRALEQEEVKLKKDLDLDLDL